MWKGQAEGRRVGGWDAELDWGFDEDEERNLSAARLSHLREHYIERGGFVGVEGGAHQFGRVGIIFFSHLQDV